MINLRRREDNKRTSVFIEILYHKSQKEKMKNVQLQPQTRRSGGKNKCASPAGNFLVNLKSDVKNLWSVARFLSIYRLIFTFTLCLVGQYPQT